MSVTNGDGYIRRHDRSVSGKTSWNVLNTFFKPRQEEPRMIKTGQRTENRLSSLSVMPSRIITRNVSIFSLDIRVDPLDNVMNVTIFFLQNFSLNSIVSILLVVKFLFCLCFCSFFMFICYQLWRIKMCIYISHCTTVNR